MIRLSAAQLVAPRLCRTDPGLGLRACALGRLLLIGSAAVSRTAQRELIEAFA